MFTDASIHSRLQLYLPADFHLPPSSSIQLTKVTRNSYLHENLHIHPQKLISTPIQTRRKADLLPRIKSTTIHSISRAYLYLLFTRNLALASAEAPIHSPMQLVKHIFHLLQRPSSYFYPVTFNFQHIYLASITMETFHLRPQTLLSTPKHKHTSAPTTSTYFHPLPFNNQNLLLTAATMENFHLHSADASIHCHPQAQLPPSSTYLHPIPFKFPICLLSYITSI